VLNDAGVIIDSADAPTQEHADIDVAQVRDWLASVEGEKLWEVAGENELSGTPG